MTEALGRLLVISSLLLMTYCGKRDELRDKIPPGNVKDLTLVSVEFFGAGFMFTAPGDDLFSGRASRFVVKYSTNQNFALSPEKYFETLGFSVVEVPEPPMAGQKVRFFVKDLEPKTRYFFGLRTYDDAGNFSDVSNIVKVVTKDVPGGSGEIIGRISFPSFAMSSDGQKIYLLFPGLHVLEQIGGESFKITTITSNIPAILESRVVWDGEKFISIGGHIGGELVQSPIAVYPDGRLIIMANDGDIVPFGPNGFFGYGVLKHKIVKIGNGFAVIGGLKFSSSNINFAIEEGKFSKIGVDKVPFFRVDGNKVIWSLIYPQATTYPLSSLEPVVINPDGRSIIMWGGNQSEITIAPSSKMSKLEFSQESTTDVLSSKSMWMDYVPFSGRVWKIYNTCESESYVKLLKIAFSDEGEAKEVGEDEIPNLGRGDVFVYNGRSAVVKDVSYVKRNFVIGRFRDVGREFSGIVAVFSDGGKDIFSFIKPVLAKQQFRFPDIGDRCYAEYLHDKLYVLHMGEIYIIRFGNYEIVEEVEN